VGFFVLLPDSVNNRDTDGMQVGNFASLTQLARERERETLEGESSNILQLSAGAEHAHIGRGKIQEGP
jgi:hypothetical protein